MENSTNLQKCAIKFTNETLLDIANETAFRSIYLPSFVFTIMMFLIGGPGNALVFYIYFAKWRKTTARIFILALAGFDMINCFVTMPMEMVALKNILQFDKGYVCKVFRYITFMMNNGSSFVLSGIAYDRYNRICKPLKSQLQPTQAKIIVIVAIVFSIVFAWPSLLLYGSMTVQLPSPTTPKFCLLGKTCLYEDKYLLTDYPLMFTFVLLVGNIIIDIALIFAYSKIGYEVVQRSSDIDPSSSKKIRKASTSTLSTDDYMLKKESEFSTPLNGSANQRDCDEEIKMNANSGNAKKAPTRQISTLSMKRGTFRQRSLSVASIESRKSQMHKTTLMLFMVTILFMGSFVPYCVIAILRGVDKNHYGSLSSGGKAAYNLFLRFYMLSSSLNPVIYCFLSVQFRKECSEFFKQIKRFVVRK